MDDTFRVGDKTYVLSPLTFGDNARITRHVQYRRWHDFQSLKDEIPEDVFAQHSEQILQDCIAHPLTSNSPEVTEFIKSKEGTAYFVFLSLRHTYEKITLAEVEELLTFANADEIGTQLAVVSGLAKKNETTTEPATL